MFIWNHLIKAQSLHFHHILVAWFSICPGPNTCGSNCICVDLTISLIGRQLFKISKTFFDQTYKFGGLSFTYACLNYQLPVLLIDT